MKVTVDAAVLAEELALAEKAIAKKITIPVLNNVLLEASDQGLRVTATDLEVGLRSRVPAQVAQPGRLTLPARKLYELARLLPETSLQIEAGGPHAQLTAASGFRAKLATMPADDYPVLPEAPGPQAVFAAGALLALIKRTQFATAADDSRYYLSGLLLEATATHLRMVATDGHRIAHATVPREGAPVQAVVVPSRTVDVLAGIKAGDVSYAVSESHLFFEAGSRLLISRRVAGEFPKWERVIPKPSADRISVGRAALEAVIRRAILVAEERTTRVVLGLSASGLSASAASESGESAERLAGAYAGAEGAVAMSGDYVLHFLGAAETEQVTLEYRGADNAVTFREAGAAEYEYVLMPIRL